MRVFTTTDEVRQIAYVANGTRLATCLGNVNGLHLVEWRDLHTEKLYGSVGLRGLPGVVAFALGHRPEIIAHANGDQIHYFTDHTYDRAVIPGSRTVTACALTNDGLQVAFSFWVEPAPQSIIAVAHMGDFAQTVQLRTGVWVRSLIFDPTGHYLVSAGVGQFTVWDVGRRESCTAGTLTDLRPPITYSHDGALLAVAGDAGATLFVADGSRMVRSVQRPGKAAVSALAFSPDNRTLFLAAAGVIHLFDVDTGVIRHTYDWNVGSIYCVAIAPDGLTAAAGADGSIVIWDLDE